MDAGRYNKHITIEQLTGIQEDSDGFETETWTPYYSNYAYVNKLSGSERWAAAQVQMDSVVRFILRWHAKLDAVKPKYFRIIFKNKTYTITNVDNVMYSNETVKIDAVEVET